MCYCLYCTFDSFVPYHMSNSHPAQALLQSDNYVTRRRSLKLLSELLLDRNNYTVMMKYISSKHHLKV